MRKCLTVVLLSVALVGFTAVSTTAPAAAHDQPNYYPQRWSGARGWFFTTEVPSGAVRDRLRNGLQAWNAVGQPFFFGGQLLDQPPTVNPYSCNGQTAIGMWWRGIDGRNNTLGETAICTSGTTIVQANIIFDNSEYWYTGTGDAPSDPLICLRDHCGEFDLYSVAVHEAGHATGFAGPFNEGHFDAADAICSSDSTQQTMCPFTRKGSESNRSLESHDVHTFDASY
jgi:hypothetical protein